MRITEAQKRILDSLIVERLKENPINVSLVNSFKNTKNPILERVITTKNAFYKDSENSIAYYIVKTSEGVVLLYFSLKCGELFEKLDLDKMNLARETLKRLYIIKNRVNYKKDYVEKAEKFIQDHLLEIQNIASSLNTLAQKKGLYEKDLSKELNKEVSRVLKTYSAIEMVEFCANDNARSTWNEFGLPKKMGECIFWHYIVPKLASIQELIGCEYVYLFAADNTVDRLLANYYQISLGFEELNTLGTNKPHYDFMCLFLCQKINVLLQNRERFYNNFNPDERQEDII